MFDFFGIFTRIIGCFLGAPQKIIAQQEGDIEQLKRDKKVEGDGHNRWHKLYQTEHQDHEDTKKELKEYKDQQLPFSEWQEAQALEQQRIEKAGEDAKKKAMLEASNPPPKKKDENTSDADAIVDKLIDDITKSNDLGI
jgi:hypothetical protein